MKKKLTALLMVLTLLLAFAPVGNAFADTGTVTKTYNIVNGHYSFEGSYMYFSDWINHEIGADNSCQGTLTLYMSNDGTLESGILNYTVAGYNDMYFLSFTPSTPISAANLLADGSDLNITDQKTCGLDEIASLNVYYDFNGAGITSGVPIGPFVITSKMSCYIPDGNNSYIASGGGFLSITGSLEEVPTPPATWTTIENTDSALVWSGSDWTVYPDSRYSGGSTTYTTTPNASVQYTFNGTSIEWLCAKSANRGQADVYIDGTLAATVDCYSPTDQFQSVVFSTNSLSSGTHTIKIVNKNTIIDVDALMYQ